MLRRVQPIALKAESESSGGSPRSAEAAPAPNDRRQTDRRQAERRQGDRRGMEALRAEALQQLITRVEDRNFNGLRNQVHWNAGFKSKRILLIAVAVIAGSMAAYLAVQRPAPPAPEAVAPVVEVVQEPRVQVLAAKQSIAVGQRLTPASLEWLEWPESAVRTDFITATTTPEAITEMSGATARTGFVAGEPILPTKLMPAGEGSYLAAVLGNGMRAVSVTVSADSASGGFVAPNDRVDVVLIRPDDMGGQVTRTIMQNVKVLAINGSLGPTEPAAAEEGDDPAKPEVFEGGIATLELDPIGAEVMMSATAHGRLTLVLRGMDDARDAEPIRSSANQAIRLSSPFWARGTY